MTTHAEAQMTSHLPPRYRGLVTVDLRVRYRCSHAHRTEDAALDCAEKRIPWVERDLRCTCVHPHPGGRHTVACEQAAGSNSGDES